MQRYANTKENQRRGLPKGYKIKLAISDNLSFFSLIEAVLTSIYELKRLLLYLSQSYYLRIPPLKNFVINPGKIAYRKILAVFFV